MEFLQIVLTGVPQGALYALFGFGMALIFSSATVMNFAHGHAGMFGACIAFSVSVMTGNVYIAIVGGMLSGVLLGWFIEKFLMRPIKHMSHTGLLIITLGLIYIFQDLALMIWGENQHSFPEVFEGNPLLFFDSQENILLVIPANDVVITSIAVAISLAFAYFLTKSKFGIAMRARAQDEVGAKVVGINTNKIDVLVWAIGISISVLVGCLAAPKTFVHPEMMSYILLFGITACVLGGFSNPFGAIFGGLVLGVIEQLVATYISPDYQLSVIFILIIGMLTVKPSGIFSRNIAARV
jgi:branched-chain amino acid transport system permease protein